ncbi:hypothetical protein [Neisseria iguanae]|uniref:hypothetical protein n=1 Tax=Neisseria iguanae TaxID=90242 RepID=UPI001B804533|nr:hypothetical protein [Neisseria iguanae]
MNNLKPKQAQAEMQKSLNWHSGIFAFLPKFEPRQENQNADYLEDWEIAFDSQNRRENYFSVDYGIRSITRHKGRLKRFRRPFLT